MGSVAHLRIAMGFGNAGERNSCMSVKYDCEYTPGTQTLPHWQGVLGNHLIFVLIPLTKIYRFDVKFFYLWKNISKRPRCECTYCPRWMTHLTYLFIHILYCVLHASYANPYALYWLIPKVNVHTLALGRLYEGKVFKAFCAQRRIIIIDAAATTTTPSSSSSYFRHCWSITGCWCNGE